MRHQPKCVMWLALQVTECEKLLKSITKLHTESLSLEYVKEKNFQPDIDKSKEELGNAQTFLKNASKAKVEQTEEKLDTTENRVRS